MGVALGRSHRLCRLGLKQTSFRLNTKQQMYKQKKEMQGNTKGKYQQIDIIPTLVQNSKGKTQRQILNCSSEEME